MHRICLAAKAQRGKGMKNGQPESKMTGIIMGCIFSLRTLRLCAINCRFQDQSLTAMGQTAILMFSLG
jgi:hypothetical protein